MTKPKQPRIYIPRYYLKRKRKELNLTQSRVASRLNMDTVSYTLIESGRLGFLMNAKKLMLLAKALDFDVSELVYLESNFYDEYCKRNHIHEISKEW